MSNAARQGHREGRGGLLNRAWNGIKSGVKAGWDWAGSEGLDRVMEFGQKAASEAGFEGLAGGIETVRKASKKTGELKDLIGQVGTGSGSGGGPGSMGTSHAPRGASAAPQGIANMRNPAASGAVQQRTLGGTPRTDTGGAARGMKRPAEDGPGGMDMNARRVRSRTSRF